LILECIPHGTAFVEYRPYDIRVNLHMIDTTTHEYQPSVPLKVDRRLSLANFKVVLEKKLGVAATTLLVWIILPRVTTKVPYYFYSLLMIHCSFIDFHILLVLGETEIGVVE
jgi:hypothetical protein